MDDYESKLRRSRRLTIGLSSIVLGAALAIAGFVVAWKFWGHGFSRTLGFMVALACAGVAGVGYGILTLVKGETPVEF